MILTMDKELSSGVVFPRLGKIFLDWIMMAIGPWIGSWWIRLLIFVELNSVGSVRETWNWRKPVTDNTKEGAKGLELLGQSCCTNVALSSIAWICWSGVPSILLLINGKLSLEGRSC